MTRMDRRQLLQAAAVLCCWAPRGRAQSPALPLRTSGLDHLSITVPDSQRAAEFYGKIFDPQLFREREGVARFYARIGAAYIAFGPSASVQPYIDHFCAGILDFNEADTRAALTAAGIPPNRGNLPMFSDPDQLRLQLVDAPHGLFDTIKPAGRVIPEPGALTPIGLDHITLLVSDIEKSAAHYRKMFGPEHARERNPRRVWFQLASTRLALEPAPNGQKPSIHHFCVKVAGFNRASAVARLEKLGVRPEVGPEKGTLRFRDLNNIPVEVVAG